MRLLLYITVLAFFISCKQVKESESQFEPGNKDSVAFADSIANSEFEKQRKLADSLEKSVEQLNKSEKPKLKK